MKEAAILKNWTAVRKLLQNYHTLNLVPQARTAPGSMLVKLDEAGKDMP